ncbi:S-type Pyocin [compost metagenome]
MSTQERALQRSSENLAKTQKLAADIGAAGQAAAAALSHFDRLLEQSQAKPASGSDQQQFAQLLSDVALLEAAQYEAAGAVRQLETMDLRVKFAREGAQRDVSSPFLNRGLQATILQQMTLGSDQYLAQRSVVSQRHGELQGRAARLFDEMELQLKRLSTSIAPTAAAFTSPGAIANVRPWVMFTEGPSHIIESVFVGLQKAIRSAVAEFTWQITSSDAEHPGTCACVLQFHFNSLADDKRFGLSVPLAELLQLEGRDWQGLALARAEVDLPLRLCSAMGPLKSGSLSSGPRKIESLPQVLLTPTDGDTVPASVRVRAAVWDEQLAGFRFATEGAAPATLLWAPPATLSSSRDIPVVQPAQPKRIGFIHIPPVPLLEPFSVLKDLQLDD